MVGKSKKVKKRAPDPTIDKLTHFGSFVLSTLYTYPIPQIIGHAASAVRKAVRKRSRIRIVMLFIFYFLFNFQCKTALFKIKSA